MNRRFKYPIILSWLSLLFFSSGCSSVVTSQFMNSIGEFAEEDNNYVTVNIRRNFGISFANLYIMEFANNNIYNGVVAVQYPRLRDNRGVRLWTNNSRVGVIIGNPIVQFTQENKTTYYYLNESYRYEGSHKEGELLIKVLYPAGFSDILKLFEHGKSRCVYNVENSKAIVEFNKVAIIGTVASKDILIWKRPPGKFSVALLFDGGGRNSYFFLSDIIEAAAGESVYIDTVLPVIASDIIRGWTSKDIFKKISKTPF